MSLYIVTSAWHTKMHASNTKVDSSFVRFWQVLVFYFNVIAGASLLSLTESCFNLGMVLLLKFSE